MSKKTFQVDIESFDELQELIIEYFQIFSSLLSKQGVRVCKIKLDIDSNKVIIETVDHDEDSEDDTEWDFEWI